MPTPVDTLSNSGIIAPRRTCLSGRRPPRLRPVRGRPWASRRGGGQKPARLSSRSSRSFKQRGVGHERQIAEEIKDTQEHTADTGTTFEDITRAPIPEEAKERQVYLRAVRTRQSSESSQPGLSSRASGAQCTAPEPSSPPNRAHASIRLLSNIPVLEGLGGACAAPCALRLPFRIAGPRQGLAGWYRQK